MGSFYDVHKDLLNFVTAFLIKSLPTLHLVIGLVLAALTLAFLMRIILSWYPQINLSKGFWFLITLPTEPILKVTRKFISPIGGVDVTPVIWVGLISLIRELVVGQQGLLSQILLKTQSIS
tara:strand:+ start:379 stop:741 length:363 start_codon:yes stop_codon:yes gene_type:complete